ncbi:MAG: isoprenylcysteine carboxylmethyltransferase family protein [Planctomycetes bacterium]|nr:isoprenylcysteine carboxylmethyltransferase family protein [Planctomycetota bacterium]
MKAVVFTAGFLLVILGVIPSLFYVLGELPFSDDKFWVIAKTFWISLRDLTGTTIFALGLGAYLFCSAWLIGLGKGPHVEFDPPKVFVASGPYRWVRNPVVITLMATVLGLAIYLNSIGILILFALGIPFAQYQVTKIEEPNLRNRFGDSYVEYCKRVNRWIPMRPTDDSTKPE